MANVVWSVEGTSGWVEWQTLKLLHQSGQLDGKQVTQAGSSMPLTPEELLEVLKAPPTPASYQPSGVPANEDPMRFVMPVNPSMLAMVAGYLGLFSVLCVFAPISLIVGVLALRDLKIHPDKTGKGRAWFGLIMGIVFTVILVLLTVEALGKQR